MKERIEDIEPVLAKPATAARMLDCGLTKIYELIKQGVLETTDVTGDKRITVASIKRLAS